MITCLNKKTKIPNRMIYRIGVLLFVLFALNTSLYAQSVTIKGTVTDAANNEPLPGATVLVVGETNGAITDVDGRYKITLSKPNVTLKFSFIGYASQTVKVSGNTDINIQLIEDTKAVDEVVVIGYGSARRGDISGAITSIKSDLLKDIPVSSAAEAITGRMAGVSITTSDGSPDAEITIRVRGGGSITQDNSPLLIVDGFPIESINDISPSDIESYTVLKDASSTAIYGARGANGVILITTKSAKSGQTTVTFNTYLQRKFFPLERKMDVLSPYEYVLSQYEYAKLRGETSNEMINHLRFYSDFEDIDIYKHLEGTDWQDEMFGGAEQYSKYYNVAVSGGNDKTQSNVSFTHNENDGLIKTSSYIRDNLSFKLNHQIFKNLKMELNSRFSNATTNGAGTSGSSDLRIKDIITARPVNGLADFVDFTNLSGTLDEEEYQQLLNSLILPTDKVKQDYRLKTDKRFDMNAAITWKVIDNLIFRSEFGVGYDFRLSERYWGPLTGKSRNSGFNLPLGQRTADEGSNYRIANTLSYVLEKSGHSVNLMVGQEVNSASASSQDMTAIRFPETISPERMFANFAKGEVLTQSTNVSADTRMLSYFGRAIYSLNDKYILNLSLRADGSTKFAPGKQWGYFPAASVAWRMAEESFIKNMPFITDLKLRASYGQAGNNRMDNDLWRSLFAISNSKTYGYGQTANPYYVPGSVMPNPDLRWETTTTQNVGTDFIIFNYGLSGTIDVYNNKTKDLLIEAEVPASTSYSTQMQNIGKTSNKGLEITLNSAIIKKSDFNLTANFNIGFNKFRIDELDGNSERLAYSNWTSASDIRFSDDYRLFLGEDLGLMYGFVSDGFYSVDDFSSYDLQNGYTLKDGVATNDLATLIGIRPGVMKLKDLDGDGHITMADRQIIGRAAAKHSGGFGLNSRYKGFDFSVFFNWKYGFDVYNTAKIEFQMLHRDDHANMLNSMNYENRFKYVDENTGELVTDLEQLRALNQNATIWSPFSTAGSVQVFQSEAVEDGSYLKLSNVTLGYSLPKTLISKYHIQQFRLYATVYNAWLWTKYSGYDPDVSNNRSSTEYNNLAPNVDYSSYPKSRSVTVGLNVTF